MHSDICNRTPRAFAIIRKSISTVQIARYVLPDQAVYVSLLVAETRYIPVKGTWPQILEMRLYGTRRGLEDHILLLDKNGRPRPGIFFGGRRRIVDLDGVMQLETYRKVALRI